MRGYVAGFWVLVLVLILILIFFSVSPGRRVDANGGRLGVFSFGSGFKQLTFYMMVRDNHVSHCIYAIELCSANFRSSLFAFLISLLYTRTAPHHCIHTPSLIPSFIRFLFLATHIYILRPYHYNKYFHSFQSYLKLIRIWINM